MLGHKSIYYCPNRTWAHSASPSRINKLEVLVVYRKVHLQRHKTSVGSEMIFIILQLNGPIGLCTRNSGGEESSVPILDGAQLSLCDWHAHLRVNDSISIGGGALLANNFRFLDAESERARKKNQLTESLSFVDINNDNGFIRRVFSRRLLLYKFESNLCKLNAFSRCDVYVSCRFDCVHTTPMQIDILSPFKTAINPN